MFVGWNRRRLTVTDRAIRTSSILVPLADVVDLQPLHAAELREVKRKDAKTDPPHRWHGHDGRDQALLVTYRRPNGGRKGWLFATHDVDRLARVVGEHAGTDRRPDPDGTPRPLPFHGRQGLDLVRASALIGFTLTVDVALWATSDLWSVVTPLVAASLATTALRRVEIDRSNIRVGSAHLPTDLIEEIRCVERLEAETALPHTRRLPPYGPRYALLILTTRGSIWGLGIPHPVRLDDLAFPLPR